MKFRKNARSSAVARFMRNNSGVAIANSHSRSPLGKMIQNSEEIISPKFVLPSVTPKRTVIVVKQPRSVQQRTVADSQECPVLSAAIDDFAEENRKFNTSLDDYVSDYPIYIRPENAQSGVRCHRRVSGTHDLVDE